MTKLTPGPGPVDPQSPTYYLEARTKSIPVCQMPMAFCFGGGRRRGDQVSRSKPRVLEHKWEKERKGEEIMGKAAKARDWWSEGTLCSVKTCCQSQGPAQHPVFLQIFQTCSITNAQPPPSIRASCVRTSRPACHPLCFATAGWTAAMERMNLLPTVVRWTNGQNQIVISS